MSIKTSLRPERMFDRSRNFVKDLGKSQSSTNLYADFDFIAPPLLHITLQPKLFRTFGKDTRVQKYSTMLQTVEN